MTSTLDGRDLVGLGFMTFALFLGAGNFIFPPMVGHLSGHQLWLSSLGFLLTAVGLPLLTVVALARVGGGLPALTTPIGKTASVLLGVMVYLAIGPLFGTPRTATVAFELGLAPYFTTGIDPIRMGFTVVYFGIVMWLALFPGRLIDTVGKVIMPVLIVALLLLAGAAIFFPAGSVGEPSGQYVSAPLLQGFVEGYQTMDALAALVFGIVIVDSIRSRGVSSPHQVTRYTVTAGVIAAGGLTAVYIALIVLGASSGVLAPHAVTGAQILTAFVHYAYGPIGGVLLAVVITLACLTTAIGLVSACGQYFSRITPLSYRVVVVIVTLISILVANVGLEQLIAISVPMLLGVYPIAITLVVLNLASSWWKQPSRVFIPTLIVATLLGLVDSLMAAGYGGLVPTVIAELPGAELGLDWVMPTLAVLIVSALYDRIAATDVTKSVDRSPSERGVSRS